MSTFEVDQKSCFGFRTTLMKGFDPLQMLTTVYIYYICLFDYTHPRGTCPDHLEERYDWSFFFSCHLKILDVLLLGPL